jgi:hypothetical protein
LDDGRKAVESVVGDGSALRASCAGIVRPSQGARPQRGGRGCYA